MLFSTLNERHFKKKLHKVIPFFCPHCNLDVISCTFLKLNISFYFTILPVTGSRYSDESHFVNKFIQILDPFACMKYSQHIIQTNLLHCPCNNIALYHYRPNFGH